MKAQSKLVLLGERGDGSTLGTFMNKGRRWPRENMNKSRGHIDSGFPGPALWKQKTEREALPREESPK